MCECVNEEAKGIKCVCVLRPSGEAKKKKKKKNHKVLVRFVRWRLKDDLAVLLDVFGEPKCRRRNLNALYKASNKSQWEKKTLTSYIWATLMQPLSGTKLI